MEYGVPIVPDSITASFADTVVTAFDNTALVLQGETRRYNFHDYTAFTNIYQLATYSWNDADIAEVGETIRLSDKVVIDSTVVPCVQNETIIYVIDSYKDTAVPQEAVGKYFKYTGTTGNVDFTGIDPSNPSNFSEVINYRFEDIYPDVSPLFWDDLGAINSRRLMDGIVANPSLAPSGTSMVFTFILSTSSNAIAFFNLDCSDINVTEYRWNSATMDYDIEVFNEDYDLKSLAGIVDSYTWHTSPVELLKDRLLVRIPIWSKTKTVITFNNSLRPPSVGEVIFARALSIGKTLDGVPGKRRNFDKTTVTSNGYKVRTENPNIVDKITYKVIISTNLIDTTIQTIGELLGDNLLIIGDETGTFTVLLNYGYTSELPFKIKSADDINSYGITINTLV
jgi:hypothetical protein